MESQNSTRICLEAPDCINILGPNNESGYCQEHHRETDRPSVRRARGWLAGKFCRKADCNKPLQDRNESGYCEDHYHLSKSGKASSKKWLARQPANYVVMLQRKHRAMVQAKLAKADEAEHLVLDLQAQVDAAEQALKDAQEKLAVAQVAANKYGDVGRDTEDLVWAYVDGLTKQGLRWDIIKARADAEFDYKRSVKAYQEGRRRYLARQEKPTK